LLSIRLQRQRNTDAGLRVLLGYHDALGIPRLV
jgi:hypothetical protein